MENLARKDYFGKVDTSYELTDDMDTQERYDADRKAVVYDFYECSSRTRETTTSYTDMFHEDYKSYIGSMITPSGKLRETPASKKDAWRYAIDEYRKRKRELNPYWSIENVSDSCSAMSENQPSPDEGISLELLVNKIFDALELKDRDYEICRYLSAVLYNTDVLYRLPTKTKSRVMKYLRTVNVKELGSTDKQMGIALNYEISAGSQCRKLVSIKKRLIDRMASIGVTRFDLGK